MNKNPHSKNYLPQFLLSDTCVAFNKILQIVLKHKKKHSLKKQVLGLDSDKLWHYQRIEFNYE